MNLIYKYGGRWFSVTVTVLVIIFTLAPLVLTAVMSFSDTFFATFPPQGFTFRWYAQVLTDWDFLNAVRYSLVLAFSATLGALLLGVPAAFAITRFHFIGRDSLKAFFLSPLIFPVLITGVSLLRLFSELGWRNVPLAMLFGHMIVTTPYVVRTVSASLVLVDISLEEAARTLGASRMRTFWRVTVPQISAGLIAGSLFAFLVSFDNYAISLWLADAQHMPAPLMLYRQINVVFDPSVSAMSTLMVLIALFMILIMERVTGLRKAVSF